MLTSREYIVYSCLPILSMNVDTLCAVFIFDMPFGKYNSKITKILSFAHADTWDESELVSLHKAAGSFPTRNFQSCWHPSELLSAFANSIWQVSKAICGHVKLLRERERERGYSNLLQGGWRENIDCFCKSYLYPFRNISWKWIWFFFFYQSPFQFHLIIIFSLQCINLPLSVNPISRFSSPEGTMDWSEN